MGTRVTKFGNIEITDPVTGQVSVRMGVLEDEPVARARLYVHGKPEIRVDTSSQSNWDEAMKLRNAWGPGFTIYLWIDTRDPTTEWHCMGEYGWRYATPPKEIALANYLLEGE